MRYRIEAPGMPEIATDDRGTALALANMLNAGETSPCAYWVVTDTRTGKPLAAHARRIFIFTLPESQRTTPH